MEMMVRNRRTIWVALYLVLCGWPAWAQDVTGTAKRLAEQGYFDTCARGNQHACSYFTRLVVWTINPQGDPNLPGALRKTAGGTNVDGYAEDALALNANPSDLHNVMDLVAGTGAAGASIRDFNTNPRRASDVWDAPKPLTAQELAVLKPGASLPTPGTPPPTQGPPPVQLQPILDALAALRADHQALRAQIDAIRAHLDNADLSRIAQYDDLVQRSDRLNRDVLTAIDLSKQVLSCAWVGSTKAFGGSVTLRCQ
jgi:hypothetical protein